jgi:general secretion pathway protein B
MSAPTRKEAAPASIKPTPTPAKVREAPPPVRQAEPELAAGRAAPAERGNRVEPVRAAPEPARTAAAPVTPPAGDEALRSLQQLPEALRREIPQVSFGGYIYSPTPGESLLLVDKMLRREGEEVAPGLVLERLLPKAAVMNYRGTRYRVAY